MTLNLVSLTKTNDKRSETDCTYVQANLAPHSPLNESMVANRELKVNPTIMQPLANCIKGVD